MLEPYTEIKTELVGHDAYKVHSLSVLAERLSTCAS